MSQIFRVGLTGDFLNPDGTIGFGDIGVDTLDRATGIEWEFLTENTPTLRANQVQGYNGLLVLSPKIDADTLDGNDDLAIIARFGVGYDNVDVRACNANGVLLTITPDGVRRPVAASVMTFILALSHKLTIKDTLIRQGRWVEKSDYMGMGITGRTLGVIGLGNIGREVFTLAEAFGMHHLAYDPYATIEQAEAAGVELVDIENLLRESDFVCICCALTPDTHYLIDAERLDLMKETAYLINTARGPIVEEQALINALRNQRIQGAGLDVFEQEPIDTNNPLLSMDNVILTPHAICWTDECFLGNGQSACQSIVDVSAGRIPKNVVNHDVLNHSQLKEKLDKFASHMEKK